MSTSVFKIDSEGTCLLCLNTISYPSGRVASDSDISDGKLNSATTAFRMLMRYLDVDLTNELSPISSLGSKLNTFMPVSLCENCSSVAHIFLGLFQAFDGIRLQLDKCVFQLLELVEKGDQNADRVREYQERTGEIDEGTRSRIAESLRLRGDTMKNVSRKVKSSSPRVVLEKLNKQRNLEGMKINAENAAEDESISMDVDDDDTFINDGEESSHSLDDQSVLQCNKKQLCKLKLPVPSKTSVEAPDLVSVQEDPRASQSTTTNVLHPNVSFGCEKESKSSNISLEELARIDNAISARTRKLAQTLKRKKVRVHIRTIAMVDETECKPITRTLKSNTNTLSCNYCGVSEKLFTAADHLELHKLSSHTSAFLFDEGRLPSGISDQQLEAILTEIFDQVKSKPSGAMECPVCRKPFQSTRTEKEMKLHLLENHLHKIIGYLGYAPVETQGSSKATRLKTSNTWECFCGKSFTRTEHIVPIKEPSVLKHSSNSSKACSSCTKFKCIHCGKILSSFLGLKLHCSYIHKGLGLETPWKCDHCDKSLANQSTLGQHVIYKHPTIAFADAIPNGVSKQDFNAAMKRAFVMSKPKRLTKSARESFGKSGAPSRKSYKCPFCETANVYSFSKNLKLHYLNKHLNDVIRVAEEIKGERRTGMVNVPDDNIDVKLEY